MKTSYGSIVALFDKTPVPQKPKDAYCPHFWELKPFNGCYFDCAYCYLNGTYIFRKDNRGVQIWNKPSFKDEKEIEKQLRQALEENETPSLYNMGEVSDGLLYPHIVYDLIIPIFKEYKDRGHKVMILTKSSENVNQLYDAKAQDVVVMSWSVNANYQARRYERRTPDPAARLTAANRVASWGYPVRLRIDPLIPESYWQDGYRDLCNKIMSLCPKAEVITLGTIRGLARTIQAAQILNKDMGWAKHFEETSTWGKKAGFSTRFEMYKFVISELRSKKFEGHISVCKETLEMWEELTKAGLVPPMKDAVCNCQVKSFA